MPVDEKTRKALDVKNLPHLPGLDVIGMEAEDYTDWAGEPALRVLVTLDESVNVEKLSGEVVGEFKAAIRKRLRDQGITLFPYVFLAKPSELAEKDED
jgi:hypothetical protein